MKIEKLSHSARSGVAESIYTYRDSVTPVANATSAQNDSKNSILL
ncbi:hypothetical protein CCP3SC5AM1_360017 [Gammaproteobacteria bacterium]